MHSGGGKVRRPQSVAVVLALLRATDLKLLS